MNPRVNRIPHPWPGGPNDDRDAEPVVVQCALCGRELDDGQRDPPPTVMRCPNCGPVCDNCYHLHPDDRATIRFVGSVARWVCDYCGAEVKEGKQ